ncbi:MAG: acyl--CoA ligase [Alphaproteobacteria bacterium]|nr:acyl--CoA ligase [Alphaproteobacteria bacterium]
MTEFEQVIQQYPLFYLTATDQNTFASVALKILSLNKKLILLPSSENKTDLRLVYTDDCTSLFVPSIQTKSDDFYIGMMTSGSTEAPRIFAFEKFKIDYTLDWYKKIYNITNNSIILSSMPTSYNFSFVAGILNANRNNAQYQYLPPADLCDFIKINANKYDKTVILANPIILDILSQKQFEANGNILIDSGGAPLSTKAIKMFREKGFDLHEGYGLTETASLTHFDQEASEKSLGTVGYPVDSSIHVELETVENKPMVKIFSPNIGRHVDLEGKFIDESSSCYLTTDIGRFDADGRLVLVGRSSDVSINGFYPKDTLEIIADILGFKCALVQHLVNKTVNIRLFDPELLSYEEQFKQKVSDALNIPMNSVSVDHVSGLLHSLKLKRKK